MSAGNVVGSGYVELRPKAASDFEQDAEKQLAGPAERMAARVGSRVGTVMGKSIGVALSEKGQAAIGGALVLLQKFADDQTQAQSKLQAAVEQSGGVIGDYQDRIDAAVQANERLGLSQDKTKNRIAELTLALGDPKKALDELNVAQDIAAGTGRSFESVVNLLREAADGNASAYAQLGVEVRDLTKAQKDLHAEEDKQVSTTKHLTDARERFNDKLAVYRQATSHTLAQQQALYRAYQDLQKAQADDAAQKAKVAAAQKVVHAATVDQGKALDTLGQKYKGQASAGADTFIGKLKAVGAEAKDSAGDVVAKYGNAAGGIGFALLGLSRVTSVVKDAFRSMRNVEIAASAEAAAGVAAGAATAETAMAGEAVVAEATAGRMVAAFATLGPAAALAGAAIGVALDQWIQGDAKKRGGTAGKVEGILGSFDFEGLARHAKDIFNAPNTVHDKIFGGSDESKPSGDEAGIEAALGAGTSNSDDDQLARQRAKHAATVAASGNKLGKAAAKATGDSFADFLKKYDLGSPVSAALEAAHQKAVDAAQKLVNDVTSKLDQAKSKLDSDVSAMRSEMQQVASVVTQGSTLADAFNDPHNAARNPFGDKPGGRGGIKSVEAFLHTRAVLIARFAKALNQLRKRGLASDLVAEIAQLGVEDGLRVAEEILSAGAADVRTLNLESQQIARAANAVGAGVAKADFGSVIAADKANADRLERQLQAANAKLDRITRNPASVDVTVSKSGASASEVGQEVGSAIRQAIKGM